MTRRTLLSLPFCALLRAGNGTDWISRLGGTVRLSDSGAVVAVNLAGRWINDSEMLDLAALPALESLDLSHTRISDEGLLRLKPARQIRELNLLFAEQITDLGLSAIRDWRSLTKLNVRGTRISDGTLAILSKLPQIEWLDIANTNVTDNGVDGLVPLTRIRHLALGRTRFNDSSLELLRLLQTLESLDLSGPAGSQRADRRARVTGLQPGLMKSLSELKQLRALSLGHTSVDGADLEKLAAPLAKVEKLGLENCSLIDDGALKHLAGWRNLKYLDVQETAVTAAGADAFIKARPDVRVLQ